MSLIDTWISWNKKRITATDFCLAFRNLFKKEILKRIEELNTEARKKLRNKIRRQMVKR